MQTDYCGIVRCKVIPAALFGNPVRLVKAGMTLLPWGPAAQGAKAGGVGEVDLVPVVKLSHSTWLQWQQESGPPHLSSHLELPWHRNHKIAIAKMLDQSGEPWAQCPKGALMRAISLLREKGYNAKAGFELEFGLLREDPEKGLTHVGRGIQYGLFDQFDISAEVIDDILICLDQMKIPVRMVHAEAAPGQFEVVLGHKDVFEAVQDVVIARLVIKAMARKHDLVATFVPCYGDGFAGSGSHVHISLDEHFGTDDVLNNEMVGVSRMGQHFMAGIVDALPWLTFLLMSSPLSYVRSQPQFWVGAYQMWAYNNKESPMRLAEDRTNFEMKQLDSVSNVDLAMAGILLAGLRGLEEGMELPEPVQGDPHILPEENRPPRLPASLEESLKEFEKACKENLLSKVFIEEMVEDLTLMKKEEIKYVDKHGISAYRDMLMTLH